LPELGVEKKFVKARNGRKKIKRATGFFLFCTVRDSTRLSIGHRGKRDRQDAHSSPSAEQQQQQKTTRKLKGGKKLEGFELKQNQEKKTEIHTQ
jgi:hypothetical protein